MRIDRGNAGLIIGDEIIAGLVRPDICADRTVRARRRTAQAPDKIVEPVIVEPHAIDQDITFRITK